MDLIPDPVLTMIDCNLDPEKIILRIKENVYLDLDQGCRSR